MNPIVFALRRPLTVMVLVVAVVLGSGLAVSRMPIDIFPNLNLPVIYVAQPYGGMDPAQMEGLLTNYYEYHFLYINGIHHVESQEHPGRRPDEALLPPRHRHGPGHGRDDRLRQPLARLHAAGHRLAVRHAVRHRQRAGRLPGALERDQDDRRDPGPGAVQGPADVRQPAGRLGAAAVRRQPAHGRRPRRSRPAAGVPDVARRGGRRRSPPATRSAPRATSASATRCRSCRSTRWSGRSRSWRRSRSGPAQDPTVYLRDVGDRRGRHRHPHRLRAGQRPAGRLHPGHQAGRCLDARGRQRRARQALPSMQAVLPDDIKVSFEFDQSPYVTRADVERGDRGRCWGRCSPG